MATTTTNYELTKAGYNDIPDIETINNNMDTLDSSLVVGESNDDVMETITKTTGWTNAEPVTLGDKFQSAMTKISTMIKNLKWIYKFIGSTDISSIGNGTITNAISTLSSNKLNASDVKTSLTDTSTSHALSTASGKALNDAIATLDGKRTWKAIQGGASPNTNYSVPTDYREVYVTVLFPSGQRVGQIIPKIGSGGQGVAMRQDVGFYYSATANGSFGAVFNSETNNVLVYTPWRNGTELSSGYSINIYGR